MQLTDANNPHQFCYHVVGLSTLPSQLDASLSQRNLSKTIICRLTCPYQQAMRVRWTVAQGAAVFEARFEDLMQAQGQVAVQLSEGQTANWQIVRLAQ